ncbi:MAG: DTW domain-containing protein [Myxococcales bacterium]|nr:DTW domain-containing protein [Myxococcales bacterium]
MDEVELRAAHVRCSTCGLPTESCFCASLPVLANRTRVMIVLHHSELAKTTNTGVLAARMHAEVRVRGVWGEPPSVVPDELATTRRLLVFPRPGARVLTPDDAAKGGPTTLIVPDGSWPQARRAARRDPLARDAEPVTLPPGPPSRYRLRRSPRADGLCTLEAIARALGVLEGEAIEEALLAALETFVARHREIGRRPIDLEG